MLLRRGIHNGGADLLEISDHLQAPAAQTGGGAATPPTHDPAKRLLFFALALPTQTPKGDLVPPPMLKRLAGMKGYENLTELDKAKLKLALLAKPTVRFASSVSPGHMVFSMHIVCLYLAENACGRKNVRFMVPKSGLWHYSFLVHYGTVCRHPKGSAMPKKDDGNTNPVADLIMKRKFQKVKAAAGIIKMAEFVGRGYGRRKAKSGDGDSSDDEERGKEASKTKKKDQKSGVGLCLVCWVNLWWIHCSQDRPGVRSLSWIWIAETRLFLDEGTWKQ
eukprot:1159539-Pelagomonas_calceolata.AAC.4